jgi:hypothetical protein
VTLDELDELDAIDGAAMLVGTGLVFVGVVVLGLVETFDGHPAGRPSVAGPVTEGGEVVATPGIDPAVRTGVVVAGLAVLALYAGYTLVTPPSGAGAGTGVDGGTSAD